MAEQQYNAKAKIRTNSIPELFYNDRFIEMPDEDYYGQLVVMVKNAHAISTFQCQGSQVQWLLNNLRETNEKMDDPDLKQLFADLILLIKKGDEIDRRMIDMIALQFKVPNPQTDDQTRKLMAKFFKANQKKPAISMFQSDEFQQFIQERQALGLVMEAAENKIIDHIKTIYLPVVNSSYLRVPQDKAAESEPIPAPITTGEILPQEIKDLVDATVGDFDGARAVRRLEKAIARNLPGIQTSYVYMVLGTRYEDLDKPLKAIESYSKAIELPNPGAYAYFFRGELFFQQENYEQARQDIQKALDFGPRLGLDAEITEQAQRYLENIDNRSMQP